VIRLPASLKGEIEELIVVHVIEEMTGGQHHRALVTPRRRLFFYIASLEGQLQSHLHDPKIYKTPHTYEFRYYRQPKHYEARLPIACNPFDQDRIAFLTGPPQVGATTAAKQ